MASVAQRKPKKSKKSSSSSSSSSWDQIKNLLSCKQMEDSQIHLPKSINFNPIYSSCSDICAFHDVVHGNTRVVHRADEPDPTTPSQETRLIAKRNGRAARSVSSRSSVYSAATTAVSGYSHRSMQLRKLSSCYECHAVVDASRYPISRSSICVCSQCGEVFPKIESLEHHQAVKHAVSELGPEDSSRNIVEIIFKSSWLKRDHPICKIERILKVHNTQRTIQRFEDYRDTVKIRATAGAKKNARCAADGNELLRFHAATLACPLGARGSSSLCGTGPACGVCTIIRHGFQGSKIIGVRTTASSGLAHDCLGGMQTRRAMLVCRVIAGRVKRVADDMPGGGDEESGAGPVGGTYDSIAGVYSDLEELYVFSSRAILPCFVVIYKVIES